MTKQEHKEIMRALNLITNYYTYFLNLDKIKGVYIDGNIQYNNVPSPNSKWGIWTSTYNNPIVRVRKYKTKARQEEANKLKSLLILSPDLEAIKVNVSNSWDADKFDHYEITWINPKLPSIKNNTIGLERNV